MISVFKNKKLFCHVYDLINPDVETVDVHVGLLAPVLASLQLIPEHYFF